MVTQKQAKQRSELRIRRWRVPINPHLPLIESPKDLLPPSAQDVARRGLVLCSVIDAGHGAPRPKLCSALKRHGLWKCASKAEKRLLMKKSITPQDKVNSTWLVECLQVLTWGLGLIELNHFRQCSEELASKWPLGRDPKEFISTAKVRPFEEIYLECDLLYRLHWASREAWLKKQKSKLDEGIIEERDRAIRWLAGVETNWDEISTDT